jgi:hypothetical protein
VTAKPINRSMPNATPNKTSFSGIRYKTAVTSLVLLVIGLFAGFGIEKNKSTLGDNYTPLSGLVQVLTISALFTSINEWLLRSEYLSYFRELRNDIRRDTSIKDSIDRFGLAEVFVDASEYKFREIIEGSTKLTISMNHGMTWLSQKAEYFKARFSSRDKLTYFIFSDPNGSASESIAKKEGKTKEALNQRVEEAIKIIIAAGGTQQNAKIFLQPFYTCQTIILTEDIAIATPYCNSSGRYTVPLFVYQDKGENSYFKQISTDILELIKESTDKTERLPESQA